MGKIILNTLKGAGCGALAAIGFSNTWGMC